MTTNVTELRSKIADVKKKIAAVSAASMPEADRAAALNEEFNILEQDYLDAVEQFGRVVALAKGRKDVGVFRGLSDHQRQAIFIGALVRQSREVLVEDIMAAAAAWPVAMRITEGERIATLNKLRRDLYALEYEDEAAVEAGQFPRREDADPRAVLRLPEEVAFSPEVLKIHEVVG